MTFPQAIPTMMTNQMTITTNEGTERIKTQMTNIISGKDISTSIREEIKTEISNMQVRPGLAVILVGNDPASAVYVRNKNKACEEVGIYSEMYTLPEETTREELLGLVEQLNHSSENSWHSCSASAPKTS